MMYSRNLLIKKISRVHLYPKMGTIPQYYTISTRMKSASPQHTARDKNALT